jgi:SpoVK/Ycf46/Vps4 family AAA+-type ATPase
MTNLINKTEKIYHHFREMEGRFFPTRKVQEIPSMNPGLYTISMTQSGEIYFEPMSIMTDNLIELPSFVSEDIIKEIDNFWNKDVRFRYERRGMTYKRGILLHGSHGTGKSSVIIRLIESEIKKGGIVFFCPSPSLLSESVKIIREIQGDQRILAVFEEFDQLLYRDEGSFLSLLDGEMQVDNIVYIATTNYLDKIPSRIKDRPSRFATVIEVGLPSAEVRRIFIENKTFPDEKVDIELWVKLTEGLTIDQMKDLIISVLCIGVDLKTAVEKVHKITNSNEGPEEDTEDLHGKKHLNDQLKGIFKDFW